MSDNCGLCGKLIMKPGHNYGINPDAVCVCPPVVRFDFSNGIPVPIHPPSPAALQSDQLPNMKTTHWPPLLAAPQSDRMGTCDAPRNCGGKTPHTQIPECRNWKPLSAPAAPSSGDAEEVAAQWLTAHHEKDETYNSRLKSLTAILESFRAATLEQVEMFVENAMADEHYAKIRPEQIRNFQSDPNWLARQLAAAKRQTLKDTEPLIEKVRIEARLDEYCFVTQMIGSSGDLDWMHRRIEELRALKGNQ